MRLATRRRPCVRKRDNEETNSSRTAATKDDRMSAYRSVTLALGLIAALGPPGRREPGPQARPTNLLDPRPRPTRPCTTGGKTTRDARPSFSFAGWFALGLVMLLSPLVAHAAPTLIDCTNP